MKIAILGLGREGQAVQKFLKRSPDYKGAEIEIRDKKFGSDYLENLYHFDIIFRSPGIPYMLKEIQGAKRRETIISSGTDLFFKNCPAKIVGITGTKGKSTTTTLIYKILKAAGKDVYLAGNIGKPALEILPKLDKDSIAVLELSSFQLQGLEHSPNIAVVLGLFPDHMDAHKSFKEYAESKANIAKWQKKGDAVFFASNNKYAKYIARQSKGKKIAIQPKEVPLPIFRKWDFLNIGSAIKIPGRHQLKNALAAAAVARYLRVPEQIILKTIANFHGLPHRLQLIRRIRIVNSHISHYIDFYNDSASTNPHTTAAAIKSFNNPTILIAGGKDKNLDYAPLAEALNRSSVKYVVLYGENKEKIRQAISKSVKNNETKIKSCENLKIATKDAYRISKLLITNYLLPATILLSPAAASFDQFKDYKERGDEFKRIAHRLK